MGMTDGESGGGSVRVRCCDSGLIVEICDEVGRGKSWKSEREKNQA